MKCFVFFSLLLSVASAITTSDILLGNWQVITQAGITCNQANCCCFNGAVNGYLLGAENYLNGTATGVCRKATQQDNIDAPPGYVFTEEFLGIDNCHFTLSNLTYNNQFGISLTMNATGTSKPTCGFQIFRPSASGLPATPDTTTPAPTAVPSYVQPFLGTWYADSTCPADSASCCCLTGTLNISVSTTQASAFLISGTPSAGCGLNTATETDDFVWPVDAFTADVGYNVTAFLVTADDYIVDYSAGMNGAANTILFKDVTRPQCSMKIASTPPSNPTAPPTTPPKKNKAHHVVPVATIFTAFIVTLLY